MDFPMEIIDIIVSHLPKWTDDVAQPTRELVRPKIASVSRNWQLAVERVVHREVRFKNDELDAFTSVFSQPRRRALLKKLRFEVVLPTYSDAECGVYESDPYRLANNKAASEAVAGLFHVLSGWGSDPDVAVLLFLHVYSPMDPSYRGADKMMRDMADVARGSRADLFEKRYEHSYIQLMDLDKLPLVPCLEWVGLHAGTRRFHPGSYLALITRAPACEWLVWNYYEPIVYPALRRKMRDELVQNLKAIRLSPSVRRLTVDFYSHGCVHSERLPNLVFPHQQDPLCAAIHQLVGNKLEGLTYLGQVDPSFFWPYPEDGPREPFWSSLNQLTVEFDMRSPSGRWYFRAAPGDTRDVPASDEPLPNDTVNHMPPGYGSERETEEALAYASSLQERRRAGSSSRLDAFRVVPEEEVMVPFLVAFARAAAQMPTLESACLLSYPAGPYFEWLVQYIALETMASKYEDYIDEDDRDRVKPRVFLYVHGWKVPEQVLDLFRRISRASHGQDAIITHITDIAAFGPR